MNISPIDIPVSENGLIEIAGPCSAESEEQLMHTAKELANKGVKIFRAGIWKPRTHPGGFEGLGSKALPWLTKVKEKFGMLIATEVASRQHVEEALRAGVDILWLGARTTANPFAVQEIAEAIASINPDTPVLVKNPVNPDLELWIGALERLSAKGITRLGAVHRGFTLYGETLYRNFPLWQIPIELKIRIPNLPIIHDPSHTGGKRDLIAPLSHDAVSMGFDGLMIEVHDNPDCALSDRSQQITPSDFSDILTKKVIPSESPAETTLSQFRAEIDNIDSQLLTLLGRRMEISRMIGQLKHSHGMKVLQPDRYNQMLESRKAEGQQHALSPKFISTIMRDIHQESIRQQI